jgi:hypothetical protein
MNGAVKEGGLLTVGIFQKDRDQPAQDSGTTLARIAIVFDPKAQLATGTPIALLIKKARVIPEDIGKVTDDNWTLAPKLKLADIHIAVGTLTAL